MASGERTFVSWLANRYVRNADRGRAGVELGIGDDMAMLRTGATDSRKDARILVTTDMLMDGVDFDAAIHSPKQIGRKALAVCLSDCAAMVVGRTLWREQGALTFRRDGSGFVMESSRPRNYDRPWAPAPQPRHASPASQAPGGAIVPEASKPAPPDATPRSEDLDPNE